MCPARRLTVLLGLSLLGLSGASCSAPQVVYHINQGSEYPRLEAQDLTGWDPDLSPVVQRFLINTGPSSCREPPCYLYLGTPFESYEEHGLRRLASSVNRFKTTPDGPARPIDLAGLKPYTGSRRPYAIPVARQVRRFPALAAVVEPAKTGESPFVGQFLVDLGRGTGADRYLVIPRAKLGAEYQFARLMTATMDAMVEPELLRLITSQA